MVDIGGELVMKGENAQMKPWRIGINKPIDDSLAVNQELQTVLQVSGVGLATSGNYRNFYYKDGKKYAHTIDPRTGGYGHRRQLCQGRCLRHRFHGIGAGFCQSRLPCPSRVGRILYL